MDVAYVGSQSRHNPRRVNLNVLPFGTTFHGVGAGSDQRRNGVVPAVEAGLPAICSDRRPVRSAGQFALPADFLRPYQGYGDIIYYHVRRDDRRSTRCRRRCSAASREGSTFGVSVHLVARDRRRCPTTATFTSNADPEAFDSGPGDVRSHALPRGQLRLERAGGRQAARRRDDRSRGLLDNWTAVRDRRGSTSGNAGRTRAHHLRPGRRQPPARHLYRRERRRPAAALPRQRRSRRATRTRSTPPPSSCPGINDQRTLPAVQPAQPRVPEPRPVAVQEFSDRHRAASRYVQFRFEAFNVLNMRAVLRRQPHDQRDQRVPARRAAAIFNNFTGLTVTNNTRPAGNTSVLGIVLRRVHATRDPRIIQLGAQAVFLTCPSASALPGAENGHSTGAFQLSPRHSLGDLCLLQLSLEVGATPHLSQKPRHARAVALEVNPSARARCNMRTVSDSVARSSSNDVPR